jgi:hypothetical protein
MKENDNCESLKALSSYWRLPVLQKAINHFLSYEIFAQKTFLGKIC